MICEKYRCAKVKKISLLTTIVLLISMIAGCGSISTNKNKLSSEDLQGFWFHEESLMLWCFKGEESLLYGFVTNLSVPSTFEVEGQTVTFHHDDSDISDLEWKSVTIEDDILSFESENGNLMELEKITQSEVEELIEIYEDM